MSAFKIRITNPQRIIVNQSKKIKAIIKVIIKACAKIANSKS